MNWWKFLGGLVRFGSLGSAFGNSSAVATRSVSTAVATKTWSPQTMGLALPRPGNGAFQRTWVLASQVTGGSPAGATPVSSGPRQRGQLADGSSARTATG